MSDEAFPRKVFRVLYFDGAPRVVERLMVSRKGSWFTTQDEGGKLHRQNGNYWSDTVREALDREAWHLMNRFASPSCFNQQTQVRHMQELLDEAFRWGELLGEVKASVAANKAARKAGES